MILSRHSCRRISRSTIRYVGEEKTTNTNGDFGHVGCASFIRRILFWRQVFTHLRSRGYLMDETREKQRIKASIAPSRPTTRETKPRDVATVCLRKPQDRRGLTDELTGQLKRAQRHTNHRATEHSTKPYHNPNLEQQHAAARPAKQTRRGKNKLLGAEGSLAVMPTLW